MNRKKEKKLSYIVLVIFAVLFILPLCWVILASLDSNANIAAKIPNLTMNNYKDILTSSTTWYSLKKRPDPVSGNCDPDSRSCRTDRISAFQI